MYTAMKAPEASIKPLMYHYTLHVKTLVTLSNSLNIIVWDFFLDDTELICSICS